MSEMQRTLDGALVPVGPHRDDLVECSDGSFVRYEDVEFVDCRGGVHSNEDDMNDANDDIVRDVLDSRDEWIGEYVASDDYGDNYAYLVLEDSVRWKDRIAEYVDEECPDLSGDVRRIIVDNLWGAIDGYDLEAHYQSNEYACYYGEGVCVDSFEVGEYEDQIEVNEVPELRALYDSGDLEGCLGRYNGDLCINENDRYDAELGRRVKTGFVEKSDHPTFYGYSGGWGRWHYAIPADRMKELLAETIADYCRLKDGND